MKQKHTKARKANVRFGKRLESGSHYDVMSLTRFEKRWDSVKARSASKSFGMQIDHVQRIPVRTNQFGGVVYKVVKHAVA